MAHLLPDICFAVAVSGRSCAACTRARLVVANYLVPEIFARRLRSMRCKDPARPGMTCAWNARPPFSILRRAKPFYVTPGSLRYCVLSGNIRRRATRSHVLSAIRPSTGGTDKDPPEGVRTKLNTASLPPPDGVVLVSAHPGQGRIMMNSIDPAVIDEADPLKSEDQHLGLQSGEWLENSADELFVCARLRSALPRGAARPCCPHRCVCKGVPRPQDRCPQAKEGRRGRNAAIIAAYSPIFQVWRTDADPRCFDLSLDPSDRAYRSLWGPDPVASNYGSVGFARVCTPEAGYPTGRALSSNASMAACAPEIRQPTLMIEYTGGDSVFPEEAEAIFNWLGSDAKLRFRVHGNHHGQPVIEGMPDGQLETGKTDPRMA